METLTLNFETNLINYISKKQGNINIYLEKLVKEDMLLNEINESKNSGINSLKSLSNLDS